MPKFFLISIMIIWGTLVQAAPHWRGLTEESFKQEPLKGPQAEGPAVEILKEMLQRANMSAEFLRWPRARALKTAEEKEHHFFFAIPRTAEHENKFKWVGPLIKENFQVVALSESKHRKIKNISELRKYRVGALYGSVENSILESHGCHAEKVSEDAQNLQKLKSGRIDFYIATPLHIRLLEKEGFKFKTVLKIEELSLYAAFHRKTPEHFIHRFNHILERMRKDGTIEKIQAMP